MGTRWLTLLVMLLLCGPLQAQEAEAMHAVRLAPGETLRMELRSGL